jgi:hypothetical protein
MYKDSEGRLYTLWGYLHPKGESMSTDYPIYANHRSGRTYLSSPTKLIKVN